MAEFEMISPFEWPQVMREEAPWHLDRARRFCYEWLKEGHLSDRIATTRKVFESALAGEFLALERELIGEEAFNDAYGSPEGD